MTSQNHHDTIKACWCLYHKMEFFDIANSILWYHKFDVVISRNKKKKKIEISQNRINNITKVFWCDKIKFVISQNYYNFYYKVCFWYHFSCIKYFLFCDIKHSLFCDVYKVNMWYHTKKRQFVISQNWFLISQYPIPLYHFDSLIPQNQFNDITNSISLIRKSFFIWREIKSVFMWYQISYLWYHNIELVISQNNFDLFNTKKSNLWHHKFDLRYQQINFVISHFYFTISN